MGANIENEHQPDWDPTSDQNQRDQRVAYDKMRKACPVAHSEFFGWSLFRPEDVMRAVLDHETFSNGFSQHLSVPNRMNPPEHTVYRKIIEPYFSRQRMLDFEPVSRKLGIKTHLNSLCRFVTRYSEMQKEREFFDILRCASGELDPQTLRATETMAHHLAFDIATSPQQDLEKFRLVSRWVLTIKAQQQKEAYRNLLRTHLPHDDKRTSTPKTV